MSAHERFRFRTARGLLEKAEALGVALPFSKNIEALFAPATIGRATVPNRLAVQPMEGSDADARGAPSELTFRRYRRFGEGGCGLIWFEATAVTEEGRANPRQLLIDRATVDVFKRLVEETRRAARVQSLWPRDILLILQLTHSGRFSKPRGAPAPVIAQRNPFLDPLHRLPADYPTIGDEALTRLQEIYIHAASLAAEAGFDGIDLKACHGYLISELLGARTRTDSRYGGPLENRTRFLLEIARGIKSRDPRFLIASRFGAFDALPFPYGFGVDSAHPGVPDLTEPLATVRCLRQAGLDLINITAGIPAYQPHFGRPFDRPAARGALPDEHPLEGFGRLLDLSRKVQREFPDLSVVGTGYSWLRHYFPFVAAAVLQSGGAALAGLGRLSLAYPDFAADLRESGALDPKKTCVACSGCSELLRAGVPTGCVVRDKAVYKRPAPAGAR
jgi:2,4-dienoyl-CoA reductase (NADPH2)